MSILNVNIGKAITLDVDTAKLPQNVMDHVVYIGLRNILMDAHAGVTSDQANFREESEAKSKAKLESMYAGVVRAASSRESVDPVRAEALRIATAILTKAIHAAGRKVADYEPKTIKAKAETLITDAILAQAKKRVDEAKTVTIDESILDGLVAKG